MIERASTMTSRTVSQSLRCTTLTMSTGTRKQERDFSPEVKALQPEVEELAKVSRTFCSMICYDG